MKKLNRKDLEFIFGGSSATAECGGGIAVTCHGTYSCSAVDGQGCSCDDGADYQECPIAGPGAIGGGMQ